MTLADELRDIAACLEAVACLPDEVERYVGELKVIAAKMEGKVLVKPAYVVGGAGTIFAGLPSVEKPCWGATEEEAAAYLQVLLDKEGNG